ncbi:MAG: LVIVD repeat-containing protein [Actinomycetota bacterium]
MKSISALVASLIVTALGVSPLLAAPAAEENSEKMKLVARTKYDGGGELTAHGRYIYSGEANAKGGQNRGTAPDDGGLHIFDTKKMKEIAFLHCPGTDNDVELVKPGLVAMAFSQNQCAPSAGTGIMLIDVKNPQKPRIISSLNTNAAHTMKPFPGGKYIYMAAGNLTGSASRGTVIVDVSNPLKPKLAPEAMDVMDCHDVSFSITEEDRQLGFCAGAVGTGEVQIWDVSDPLKPTIISRIVNPAIQYSHYAIANDDGTLLAIDDEAAFAHDCNTGQSPTGRVWIYDITDPQIPIPQGSFAPPAGRGGNPMHANIGTFPGWVASWCLSHGLDWHPKKPFVAVTWFTAGVSVIDATDPTRPAEYAYFDSDDSATYSALWHGGYLATNDHMRGLDLFEVKGL